jgi:hypothetical protein
MRVLDAKFQRACNQIRLLNHRIKDKQVRYNRAYKVNQRSWWYTLRLQLASMEGMRNMFYEYAYLHADEMEALQDILVEAGVMEDSEVEDMDYEEE